jgi:antirestriction protein ArdC
VAESKTLAFDIVNERILKALGEGVIPWRKPWLGAEYMPRSVDGRPYSGINVFLLGLLGYEDPRFLTYKKATEMGGKVTPGEKSCPVVFWKQLIKPKTDEAGSPVIDPRTGKPMMRRIPFLRWFNVFNVAQTEGIEFPPTRVAPAIEEFDAIEAVDALIAAMPNPPTLRYVTGDRAYYSPKDDQITLPKRGQFESAIGLAEAILHEHVHSTGHASRLDREGIGEFDHFGSGKYAREELIAAFGTAFLMGELGIEGEGLPNVTSYIDNWRQRIKDDPKLLVVAAGRGQRAANYILDRIPAEEQEEVAA